MAQTTDWAYAAGVIDSDGCICMNKNIRYDRPHPYYYRVSVRVCQTELAVLVWLKETFGGSVFIQNRQRGNHRECWAWSVRNREGITNFLEGILPYLKLKQQQAQSGLDFYEHIVNHRPTRNIAIVERQAQEILAKKISELNTCHKGLGK